MLKIFVLCNHYIYLASTILDTQFPKLKARFIHYYWYLFIICYYHEQVIS